MKEEIIALVRQRFRQATDTLKEAEFLLTKEMLRGALNRCYYSIFYATLALLAIRQLGSSKHSGVIDLFHREFVKSGLFPITTAKLLAKAFELRCKSDYKEFIEPDKEQVAKMFESAKTFVEKARVLAETLISKE